MRRTVIASAALVLLCSTPVGASPVVPLEHPVYLELARLRALGRLPPYVGGVRPLTERRIRQLLADAGSAADAAGAAGAAGWWVRPLERVSGGGVANRDRLRPYSTVVRPRDVTGAIGVSCERRGGRPCGTGLGLSAELDSSVGYGDWLSGSTRLRGFAGSDAYAADVAVDRAVVAAELGPVAIAIGRDALVLGQGSRTQLLWGDNAPPLDAVRLSTAAPFDLVGPGGSQLRLNVFYALGRLRGPQTFPGNLVSIARAQLDIVDAVEVGMGQLLQLGGRGAPHLSPWGFITEHITRGDASAGPNDTSNRRLFLDVAVRIEALAGARVYYEHVAEDSRLEFLSAMWFDFDYLLGVELAAIGPGRRHAVIVEAQRTGIRSQEHAVRTTGLTSAGRLVGSPLGPDARSLFVATRLALGATSVMPWLEAARFASDTYELDDAISRTGRGVHELRLRIGGRLQQALPAGMRLEVDTFAERVVREAFVVGRQHTNLGATVALTWDGRFPAHGEQR